MKLITSQSLANKTASRWLAQYPKEEYHGTDKWEIGKKLAALGDNPKIEEINKIIGNESWTRVSCDNCNLDKQKAISFTIFDSVFWICKDCLSSASNLIKSNT